MFFLSKRVVAVLLCLALLAKVVVPVGFMPDLEALSKGAFKITICSSFGPKQIIVDPTSHESGGHQDHAKKNGNDICPFAALTPAALASLFFMLALPTLAVLRRLTFSDEQPVPLFSSGLGARGPPLLLN